MLGLTWSLVLNSLIAHGASFLFLNDQLKSPSLYVRTVGRMYVVLVSVSLSLTILLPFLIMTFGTIVVR